MRGNVEPNHPVLPPISLPWYLKAVMWIAFALGAAITLFGLLGVVGGIAAGSKRGRGR